MAHAGSSPADHLSPFTGRGRERSERVRGCSPRPLPPLPNAFGNALGNSIVSHLEFQKQNKSRFGVTAPGGWDPFAVEDMLQRVSNAGSEPAPGTATSGEPSDAQSAGLPDVDPQTHIRFFEQPEQSYGSYEGQGGDPSIPGAFSRSLSDSFFETTGRYGSYLGDQASVLREEGFYGTDLGQAFEGSALFGLDEAERFAVGGLGSTRTADALRETGGFLNYFFTESDNLGNAQDLTSRLIEGGVNFFNDTSGVEKASLFGGLLGSAIVDGGLSLGVGATAKGLFSEARFVTHGLDIDPLSIPEGRALVRELKLADPTASYGTIIDRAENIFSTGLTRPAPRLADFGESFYKYVATGDGVSDYTPFFVSGEKNSVLQLMSPESITDALGLPKANSASAYDVYRISAIDRPRVFESVIANTSQGSIYRSGGFTQTIIPNRSLFTDPVYLQTVGGH